MLFFLSLMKVLYLMGPMKEGGRGRFKSWEYDWDLLSILAIHLVKQKSRKDFGFHIEEGKS